MTATVMPVAGRRLSSENWAVSSCRVARLRLTWASQLQQKGPFISRSAGLLFIALLSCAITVIIAWPVVLAPSRLVYGDEIVGRQADLHAVISQFSTAKASELLPQAVTLLPGALLSRALSPVTALNVVVLWTFPLTAL